MDKISKNVIRDFASFSASKVEGAFDIIYKKYRLLIYYVSFEILKNNSEVEDIVEETFIRLFDYHLNFKNESNIKYFLVKVAKNLSINRLKEIENQSLYSDDLVGKYDKEDINFYLEEFKDILDEEELNYLIYHLLYGFSYREIAKERHTTTASVSSKYHRAVEKLKIHYGGQRK